jgi:microcystin-dependent protein
MGFLVSSLAPSGAVLPFAGNSAPDGWLLCDGSAVSRTTYAALFAAIGTAYGSGDGLTTFNLPNTQGVFLRGAGSQTISAISYTGTRGATQGDQAQGHYHSYSGYNNSLLGLGSVAIVSATGGSIASATAGGVTSLITDGTNGTPRTGTETRPANIGVNHIIKF